ncbi:hypothetical protein BC941DRAFT_515708 [Chlamydoabsidia padenii]|nr:hypothetical protein BC941DRAFT_515708 [Chlamydoabsidia padenii]
MRYLLNHWSGGNHCRLQALVKNLKQNNFKALRQKLHATPEEKRWGDLDTADKFQEEAVAKGTPLNCCEINGFAWNNSDDNGRMYTTTRNMARQKAVHKSGPFLEQAQFQQQLFQQVQCQQQQYQLEKMIGLQYQQQYQRGQAIAPNHHRPTLTLRKDSSRSN